MEYTYASWYDGFGEEICKGRVLGFASGNAATFIMVLPYKNGKYSTRITRVPYSDAQIYLSTDTTP